MSDKTSRTTRTAWTAILAMILAAPLAAQTDLFISIEPDIVAGGDPPPGVEAIYPAIFDLDQLSRAPAQLRIEIPKYGYLFADLREFYSKEGYDAPGVPSPESTVDELRYVWRGQGQDFDVVVAVAYGWISGTIAGWDGDYTVRPLYDPGSGALVSFTLEKLSAIPFDEEPPIGEGLTAVQPLVPAVSEDVEVWPASVRAEPSISIAPPISMKSSHEQQVVKVLFAYTEQARIDAGGNTPGYEALAAIYSIVDLALAENHQAFENSLIDVRLESAGIKKLADFTPAAEALETLTKLQRHTAIKDWKADQGLGVDLVSVFLRDSLNGCGLAYVQRPGCGGTGPIETCNPGPAYAPYAIHWLRVDCIRDWKTFSHEVGHNFGLEHAFEDESWFTRDRALFTDAFGFFYFDGMSGIRTMMVTRSAKALPRILYYATPYVQYRGISLGILNDRFNARAAMQTTPTLISIGGNLSAIVFFDNFEASNLEAWNAIGN